MIAVTVPAGFVLVPEDTGPTFSDSMLPREMISAGMDVLERADDDLAGRNGKDVPDWDYGMEAVAVYRAMIAARPAITAGTDAGAVERLMEAVEGECEGLALSEEQARAILSHLAITPETAEAVPVAARPGEAEHKAGAPATCNSYMPDYQAGGDCVTCGRVQEDHAEFAALASVPAPAGDAVGYMKPETEWTMEPRFVRTEHMTEEWMPGVFTIPVYAHPAPEDTASLREELERESKESYEIGKRDGYEQAVQHIDERTGGDGEYCCVVGHDADDRHCPDSESMIARIVGRFETLSDQTNTANHERDTAHSQLDDARREIRTAREDALDTAYAEARLGDTRVARNAAEWLSEIAMLPADRAALRASTAGSATDGD